MNLKVIFLILIFSYSCFAQLVRHEYFGLPKERFSGLKWKVERVDTHWKSRTEKIYMGETWAFRTTSYDTIRLSAEELRYFFHGGQALTAIQFIHFSYDSMTIMKKLSQFSAILRSNGINGFNPQIQYGVYSSYMGAGHLTYVFRFELFVGNNRFTPTYHGSLVVDFSRHYYSIVQNWDKVEPYYISLNFYPYNNWTTFVPINPNYTLEIPEKIELDNINRLKN